MVAFGLPLCSVAARKVDWFSEPNLMPGAIKPFDMSSQVATGLETVSDSGFAMTSFVFWVSG
jgi:hypothetical protein